jgi:hypothetical protein
MRHETSGQERYTLSKYDDFPVHQSPYPVSTALSTDFSFDEGYMWGAVCPRLGIYLLTGFRITPNADVIGGHAGINRSGVTRTLRFSREWRKQMDTVAGPYRVEFTRPMEEIRLVLDENPSRIEWDLRWHGVSPPHLSSHHLAVNRGRRTTDQSRYNQVGRVEGWAQIDGERIPVEAADWLGIRDHSWGIYEGRPPLAAHAGWLPPPEVPAARRALRFSFFFDVDVFNGYFHLHEDEEGRQLLMNDAFGTPFEGVIDWGWSRRLALRSATHALTFVPGTRSVSAGTLAVVDADGGTWTLRFETTAPPYVIVPVGYHLGSWKDGGNIHTWHGPDDPYIEWDEFDFSAQPASHTLYGETEPRNVYGVEHYGRVEVTSPDGRVHKGRQHTEVFLNGRYAPYGFDAPAATGHGLVGRGIL